MSFNSPDRQMELSRTLREYSRSVSGKQQLLINAYAKALECIPKALATNSGFDQTNILNQLRQKHHEGKRTSLDGQLVV